MEITKEQLERLENQIKSLKEQREMDFLLINKMEGMILHRDEVIEEKDKEISSLKLSIENLKETRKTAYQKLNQIRSLNLFQRIFAFKKY